MTLLTLGTSLGRLALDMQARLFHPGAIPMVYFTDTTNVGDLLNEYLIPRIAGRPVVKVRSAMQPHLRGIGSVLGSASRVSHIWGSGSIDGVVPRRRLSRANIHALRGERTREVVNRNLDDDLGALPLGDPALLMPMFFNPQPPRRAGIGIVAHFSDEARIAAYLREIKSGPFKLISVKQQPEAFIAELCACEAVFSSSLHGLVLADAYGIANKWISVSDLLLGGEFKFGDYYSVTDQPQERVAQVANSQDLVELLAQPELYCAVKAYTGSLEALLSSFPTFYVRTR